MTRVLFMGPLPEPVTGHSLACQVLLEHLQKNHAVDIVDFSKKALINGVDSGGRILEIVGALAKVLARRARSDISYLTISESLAGNLKDLAIYLLLVGKLDKMVLHLHGGSIKKDVFDRYPLLRGINRFFLRQMGRVIILGERHRPIFAGMIDDARVCVVRNFAEDFLFSSVDEISRKFRLTSPIRILFLSNLIAGKGHDVLVQAYAALPPAVRNEIRLDFAGSFESGGDKDAFLASIQKFSGITYHGPVRGAAKKVLFDSSHVLCLPTMLSEGQPIAILEAYAAGCAVIATDCGGIPDIFTPEVNGFGAEPGSPQSLCSALETVAARSAQLHEFALRNHCIALERYREADYARNITEIIDDVAGLDVAAIPAARIGH